MAPFPGLSVYHILAGARPTLRFFAARESRRRARVLLGEPIDLKPVAAERARTAAHEVTVRLEEPIQQLMKAGT
jgi:hypothetical protein